MRKVIVALKSQRSKGQNPGLLLQRFLCEKATGTEGNPEEKRAILEAAIKASQDQELLAMYRQAFGRWRAFLQQLDNTVTVELQSAGRLIVGLGSENVLETGITLNHVFGLPIIPGSGQKGLAAHYCDHVWGGRLTNDGGGMATRFRNARKKRNEETEPQGDYHRLLFGNTDESGCIIFHDAWFVPDSDKQPLRLDVMTPHHLDWLDGSVAPTDFDSPNPVPFLSVSGRFLFAMSWNGPRSHPHALAWTKEAMKLLTQALRNWGIGGKTSSGYGRFVVPQAPAATTGTAATSPGTVKQPTPPPGASVSKEHLSPMDRKIMEFLEKHPNRAEKRQWLKLAQELKNPKGVFQDPEERIYVATKVKEMMQESKVWQKRDRDANMSDFIQEILAGK